MTSKKTIIILTFAGYIPFAFFTLLIARVNLEFTWLNLPWTETDSFNDPVFFLKSYAAVILSFLGGIYWGLALTINKQFQAIALLIWSNIITLLAWLTLLDDFAFGSLLNLSILFLVQWSVDCIFMKRNNVPSFFIKVRHVITVLVVPTLLFAAFNRFYM